MSTTLNKNLRLRGIEGEVKRIGLVRAVPSKRGFLRVHAGDGGVPLCGGGHKAKSVHAWQTDLAEPNCKQCLEILARRETLAQMVACANVLVEHGKFLRSRIEKSMWRASLRRLKELRSYTDFLEIKVKARKREALEGNPPPRKLNRISRFELTQPTKRERK